MSSDVQPNILDVLASALARRGVTSGINVVATRSPSDAVDLIVVGQPSVWRAANGTPAPVEGIALCPEVESLNVRGRQRKARLRLRPSWVALAGGRLELGSDVGMTAAGLVKGRRVVLDFCDPNSTKALHVGHLRNLALGEALACVAASAGAEVVTLSHVGDMGRSMGEALAGYRSFFDGRTPASAGMKGDRLVGECYSRYVAETAPDAGDPPLATDPALSREDLHHGDLADELLAAWADGEPAVTALWSAIRSWVTEGHSETLERLGVTFDRIFYESDYADRMGAFLDLAMRGGVAERAANGAVVHLTGRDEYPLMLLERADGQWTQYLRCLALWHAMSDLLEGSDSIQVMGREWLPLEAHGKTVLSGADGGAETHPKRYVAHGMVTADGAAVSSSAGSAWLIDDLLEELSAHSELVALHARHERVEMRRLAAIVALGHFLGQPASAPVSLSLERLLDERALGGWVLARAWVEAWDPRFDGPPDPDPDDLAYRFLAVQSQLHRRFVREALETLDVQPLHRFHAHLCRWFLSAPREPRVGRAMRTVLGSGLSALGLAGRRPGTDS